MPLPAEAEAPADAPAEATADAPAEAPADATAAPPEEEEPMGAGGAAVGAGTSTPLLNHAETTTLNPLESVEVEETREAPLTVPLAGDPPERATASAPEVADGAVMAGGAAPVEPGVEASGKWGTGTPPWTPAEAPAEAYAAAPALLPEPCEAATISRLPPEEAAPGTEKPIETSCTLLY